MERLNRVILYKPSNKEEKPTEVKEEKENQLPGVPESEKLAKWISAAEMINKSALCKSAGIDRANLDKYLSKGEIPEKFIKPLTEIVKKYGYL